MVFKFNIVMQFNITNRSSSTEIHSMWITTTFSSSLNVRFTVAEEASCVVCHKVDTGGRNVEVCGALRHAGVCDCV